MDVEDKLPEMQQYIKEKDKKGLWADYEWCNNSSNINNFPFTGIQNISTIHYWPIRR